MMNKKQRAHRFGLRAEKFCAWWLRLKGYFIVGERVQTFAGEIDIVARRGRTLCFIEVKARPNFEQAIESVTAQKQQRIARAAAAFIGSSSQWQKFEVRFDVMTVIPRRWPRHITQAWSL